MRAEQYSDELLVGPAVVFRHGANWQRLDHYISSTPDLPLDTRPEMVRQLAEALDHAHRRHLYHRALAPRSVYVGLDGHYPKLRIADWQVAARPATTTGGTARTAATTSQTAAGGAAALLAPDATPIARYTGGVELLSRLVGSEDEKTATTGSAAAAG